MNKQLVIDTMTKELREEPLEIYDSLMLKFKENSLFKNLSA